MKFEVGIIGCGLIGKKRSMNLGRYGRVTSLCDKKLHKAKKLLPLLIIKSKGIDFF